MTSQYLNTLYHDLFSNSPQTVTLDIPAEMGTGQIAQVVTKQGAVVSDWKMNYFSDAHVQGINSEEYIQLPVSYTQLPPAAWMAAASFFRPGTILSS